MALPLAGYTNFSGGSTGFTVYKGAIVVCDVSDTDGYFRDALATATTNAAAGDIFGGIALEKQTVTSADTADGSKKITVARNGIWGFPSIGAITDVGAAAYATEDGTISTASATNFWVGRIVAWDATYVWVDISEAAGQLQAPTPH
jgi:hypothetical protein